MAVSHATTHPALPALSLLLSEAAAGALGVIGAVALFLGLFLRGGVYRGPRPLTSRSADDAAAIASEAADLPVTGPRTGPSADGSGPPRPGPPARGR
jgi:hypothetical protein